VDGLRARLVAPSQIIRRGEVTPISLQFDVVMDPGGPKVAKRYDLMGVTSVPIPQPFFVDCRVDGATANQRDDLPVVIPAYVSGIRQPSPEIRELILHPGIFEVDGRPILSTPGRHRLELGLNFRYLIRPNDPEVWEGQLRAPPLEFEVR